LGSLSSKHLTVPVFFIKVSLLLFRSSTMVLFLSVFYSHIYGFVEIDLWKYYFSVPLFQ